MSAGGRSVGRILVVVLVIAVGVGYLVNRGSTEPAGDPPPPAPSKVAQQLIVDIDQGELCHRKFYGRYTDSLADIELVVGGRVVGPASDAGLDVDLDSSLRGRSYIVRIRGRGVDTYLSRRGTDFVDYGDSRAIPVNRCRRARPSADAAPATR